MGKQDRHAFRKGKRSELVALQALQRLRLEGVIRDFSFRDEPGVDFKIQLPDSREMLLQVKSSHAGSTEHRRRYQKVPCVIVRYGDRQGKTPDPDTLIENVRESIRDCIESF
ncbi:MAG: hypothetical protein U1C57_03165 [Candidatus Doudnabacteria bacterium]|nr:hypothetical protein [bacterium]MDZ4244076.1 hypothetical protein [Candidatus Doudnabacteria bacterium]